MKCACGMKKCKNEFWVGDGGLWFKHHHSDREMRIELSQETIKELISSLKKEYVEMATKELERFLDE